MGDERIIEHGDGWHFKIRGGNTVGPFADRGTAEVALANYRDRWRQRTDPSPSPWRNWRRLPAPLPATRAENHEITQNLGNGGSSLISTRR